MLLACRSAIALSDMDGSLGSEEYTRDILLLQVEKPVPILIARNCADLGATEDAIPVSHNTPIPQIQKEFRQQPQQKCNPSPETSNLLQDEKHGR